MTAGTSYTIDQFIEDARRIVVGAGGDGRRIAAEIAPLMRRVVWDDRLLDPARRREPDERHPRARYVHSMADDGSLQIYVVEFAPNMPTPIHDHLTWGLIGICGGAQRTARYERLDDGSVPGRAELRLIEDRVLERGEVYPLVAPADIHRIETVGPGPSYSLHVIGAELSRQRRHVFDPARGTVAPFAGRSM